VHCPQLVGKICLISQLLSSFANCFETYIVNLVIKISIMEESLMRYSEKLKKELLKTSHKSAKIFLYKHGYNSSSFMMPDYYQVSGFETMKLSEIDWKKRKPITKTLDIFTPKGDLSWRRFSFFHPFMFWHIVKLLTEEENWNFLKKHLCQQTKIACYSIPIFKLERNQTIQGESIESWLQMAEKDLLKDCADFNCLALTDIQNFYSSIYTHSISWTLHSKKSARSDRFKYELLGTKLDRLFQNSRDTQTNGIPTGSLISDIVAEIILVHVDCLLSKWLKKEKLDSKIIISRFRDDYRILSKDRSDANRVLKSLTRILCEEFDLILNENKTYVYDDIIGNAFRPWIIEIKHSYLIGKLFNQDQLKRLSFNFIKDVLVETYRIQKKYPQGRPAISILSKLSEKVIKSNGKFKINDSDISELGSILRKIILTREETTPYIIFMIDTLLTKSKLRIKNQFIKEMIRITKNQPDAEYQLIWLYRLCLSQAPILCKLFEDVLVEDYYLLKLVYEYKKFQKNRNYYDIFKIVDGISSDDRNELAKFSFINIKRLNEVKNKKIEAKEISPFQYKIIQH